MPLWKAKDVAQQLCPSSVAWFMEVRTKNTAITFRFILANNIHYGIRVWSCMGNRNVVIHMERYGRSTFRGDITEFLLWDSIWPNDGSVSQMAQKANNLPDWKNL